MALAITTTTYLVVARLRPLRAGFAHCKDASVRSVRVPDPRRKTVSATEVPALFGESPYLTRWMLYQQFANGVEFGAEEDERMRWGRKMQPLLIEQAAQDLKLAVEPDERYVTRGPIGCTRDARVFDPVRGWGALECKVVFDYKVWMEKWSGGQSVPRHYEIQLAVQMEVGDGGDADPYEWGVIVAWVGAHQYYFERTRNAEFSVAIEKEAARFLDDVANRREPDPLGRAVELPLLAELYPTIEGKVLDLREQDGAELYTDRVRVAIKAKTDASANEGLYQDIRAELIGLMRDHDTLLLPDRTVVRLSNGKQRRLNMWMPED